METGLLEEETSCREAAFPNAGDSRAPESAPCWAARAQRAGKLRKKRSIAGTRCLLSVRFRKSSAVLRKIWKTLCSSRQFQFIRSITKANIAGFGCRGAYSGCSEEEGEDAGAHQVSSRSDC